MIWDGSVARGPTLLCERLGRMDLLQIQRRGCFLPNILLGVAEATLGPSLAVVVSQ